MNEPTSLVESEADDLVGKLLIISGLRILLVTASLGASLLLDSGEARGTLPYGLMIAAYAVSIAFVLGLRVRQGVQIFAIVQVVVDSLLASALVVMTGGVDSVFVFAYVFVVIGAAMTLYRMGAVLAVLGCLSAFGVISLVQSTPGISIMPEASAARAVLSMLSNSIALGLVGILSSTLAVNLRAAGEQLAQKESDLEELQVLHAKILSSLPSGLITLSEEGEIRYANESARAILQRSDEELIGAQLALILPSVAESWRRGTNLGARDRHERSQVRPDGSTIRIGFSFAPLGSADGGHSTMIVFQDVTDIVLLREAVERAERLAMVGNLASGLAHEIRNPLASMCASIHVIRGALNPPEHLSRLMENVFHEADRLNNLITDFLAFARPRPILAREADLSQCCGSVLELFRRSPELGATQVVTDLAPNLVVWFDSDAIRQVLWNLLKNAAQVVQDKSDGRITLRTRRSGDVAEIVVEDNGPRVPPDRISSIFEPFFTTKDGGTGLGLPIAQSLVGAHRGQLLLRSSEAGAQFVVQLPVQVMTPLSLPALTI